MIGIDFAQPHWIHLIWLIIGLTLALFGLNHRGNKGLKRFLSPIMQNRLVNRPTRWHQLLRIGLLALSGTCLVIALMRPQSGHQWVHMPRIGSQLMICLDVSKSMLAEDVAPNRLKRSVEEIKDLLTYIDKDHVGLIGFSGMATVLCPMTPDFGFLRLILDSAGPHSVARGGTNLEAPIRKALAGFQGQSDLSQVILLITDGEDHDSFALEAAKAAADQGVRIIAIGFGHKDGAEVFVTDPQTEARHKLLDAFGQPVISRLNNELLSKLALTTNGAYIPAGTGALDLKSIYDAHIAPLMRGQLDDHGQLTKQEQYQWAVFGALACLIATSVVTRHRISLRPDLIRTQRATLSAVIGLLMGTNAWTTHVEANGTEQIVDVGIASTDASQINESLTVNNGNKSIEIHARETYNEAIALMKSNRLDEAESSFKLSRQHADSDGRVRYCSSYNLGWVEYKNAAQLMQDQPRQALDHLYAAGNWFREAIQLQPDEPKPRENLEIVARKALALADSLAKQQPNNLAVQLDELIEGERQLLGLLQVTTQQVNELDQAARLLHMRDEFRQLEVDQRQLLAQLEELSKQTHEESDRLSEIEKTVITPEQKLRLAQLCEVEKFLYRTAQSMGQARGQLKTRQAERAYRRASTSLSTLKQARDQLRDVVKVLGTLIPDATLLTRQIGHFASPSSTQITQKSNSGFKEIPAWLSKNYLADSTVAIGERTRELIARVRAGLAVTGPDDGDKTPANTHESQEIEQNLLKKLYKAVPLLGEADRKFSDTANAINTEEYEEAYQDAVDATAKLIKAKELFLDIRSLIELMYTEQRQIRDFIRQDEEATPIPLIEYLPLLEQIQTSNKTRASHLDRLLVEQLAMLATKESPSQENPSAIEGETTKSDDDMFRQQADLGRQLLVELTQTFEDVHQAIGNYEQTKDDHVRISLSAHVDRSIDELESLRRLFFSITEHLRETAQRQAQLTDETRDVVTLTDPNKLRTGMGPLATRQQEIATISKGIADSLKTQSQQSSAMAIKEGVSDKNKTAPTLNQASQAATQQLAQAGKKVTAATDAMNLAIDQMNSMPAQWDFVHDNQAIAEKKLLEAIQLLEPPSPPDQQDKNQSQDQDQDEEQQQDGKQAESQPQLTQGMGMDQILQLVRDREAQRQREKKNSQPSQYAPVDKDW